MTHPIIPTPHDAFFRASLQNPEVAREAVDMYFPEYIKSQIDIQQLTPCPVTFVDEKLKLSHSDALLKTTFAGKEAYIYLLCEHQSTVDKFMPLRMMKYLVRIWEYHFNQTKKPPTTLPAIFPLLFYTGKGAYNAPLTLWELCDNSDLMQQILQSPIHLVDVNQVSEKVLQSHLWAGTMAYVMRPHFRQHLAKELEKIATNLNAIGLSQHAQYVIQLIEYIIHIDDEHRSVDELVTIIHDKLLQNVEKEIMTLADRLKQEGIDLGKLDAARKFLQAGLPFETVINTLELSPELVEKLRRETQH